MRQGLADEAVLAEALRRAVRATSAYGSVLYLPSADRRGLVLSAVAGVPVELLSGFRHLSVAAPLPASEAFRTGRTVMLTDPEETMRRYPRVALGLPHLQAFACTPVSADGHPLGVLAVVWPAGYHPSAGCPPAAQGGGQPAGGGDRRRSAGPAGDAVDRHRRGGPAPGPRLRWSGCATGWWGSIRTPGSAI
ncbi:hypothetical protein GCM10020229_47410 [Kitasatospora albolonga]|uniref:GAF domain-containing protein n=1 Tax=Kitasatospora albolonga TaxID=68173 RepID=UPI0031F1A483